MDSGIYVLRFSTGEYYIGKSDNIPKRWEQHWKDFAQGTHSKKMQECFNRCGYPTPEVYLECHSDHVDVYESLMIRANLGPNCLNTALPKEVPQDEADMLINNIQWVKYSTAEHFKMIKGLTKGIQDYDDLVRSLQFRVNELETMGIQTPANIEKMLNEQESNVVYLLDITEAQEKTIAQQEATITKLRNRSLIGRIFNTDFFE